MSSFWEVDAPSSVWRIGRGPDPLEIRDALPPEDLDRPGVGNRFDSPLGDYEVLYFSSSLEGCFGETLARFRPDLEVMELIKDEWQERGFMEVGGVPAEWRYKRLAVNVSLEGSLPFLDLEHPETIQSLRIEMASILTALGYTDLDIAAIRGGDRQLTRYISRWAYMQVSDDDEPLYDGIRYRSRINNNWECWVVFADAESIEELEMRSISRTDPALNKVARLYKLKVF